MEWRKIEGFERYSVSDTGLVRNDETGRMLKPYKMKNGYLTVTLYNGDIRDTLLVHRLVAEAFIYNPMCRREVNHIDGNKENCSLSNLEWATHSENQSHRFFTLKRGSTKEQLEKMRQINMRSVLCVETGVTYDSFTSAGLAVGLSRKTIARAAIYNKPTRNGYHFEFAN